MLYQLHRGLESDSRCSLRYAKDVQVPESDGPGKDPRERGVPRKIPPD